MSNCERTGERDLTMSTIHRHIGIPGFDLDFVEIYNRTINGFDEFKYNSATMSGLPAKGLIELAKPRDYEIPLLQINYYDNATVFKTTPYNLSAVELLNSVFTNDRETDLYYKQSNYVIMNIKCYKWLKMKQNKLTPQKVKCSAIDKSGKFICSDRSFICSFLAKYMIKVNPPEVIDLNKLLENVK